MFAAKIEEGREGQDGKPNVGPIYRNLLSVHGFPPLVPEISTGWDIFKYDLSNLLHNHTLIFLNAFF